MSRTYCGTALGGTTPDASTASGSICVDASRLTISPELILSAGGFVALKFPMLTVRGEGTSVYSAADAAPAVRRVTNITSQNPANRLTRMTNLTNVQKAQFC